jgi:hypothetical protein
MGASNEERCGPLDLRGVSFSKGLNQNRWIF